MPIDVEAIMARKLASMFPEPGIRAEAERLLASYGVESYEKEIPRVRLAILKNTGAGGDLEALRAQVRLAKQDYRDALVAAEYGRQAHELFTMEPKKRKHLAKQDQDEYRAWLES
jgi:hypothetical protein